MILCSIVITAYKEPNLDKCLDSILNQKLPKNYEILVLASDKETLDIAKRYQKKNRKIRIIKDPGKGKPTALNIAFKKAKGMFLILTDGDVILGKNSIQLLLKKITEDNASCVSGRPVAIASREPFKTWSEFLYEMGHLKRLEAYKKNKPFLASGYLYCLRKKDIKGLKIPENIFADDAFVSLWLINRGKKISYQPEAKVFVKFPLTLKDFLKQKRRTIAGHHQLKLYFTKLAWRDFKSEAFGWIRYISEILKLLGIRTILLMPLFALRLYLWLFSSKLVKKSLKDVWVRVETTK